MPGSYQHYPRARIASGESGGESGRATLVEDVPPSRATSMSTTVTTATTVSSSGALGGAESSSEGPVSPTGTSSSGALRPFPPGYGFSTSHSYSPQTHRHTYHPSHLHPQSLPESLRHVGRSAAAPAESASASAKTTSDVDVDSRRGEDRDIVAHMSGEEGEWDEDNRLGPDEVELSDWSDDDESITFADPLSMYGAGGLVQSTDYAIPGIPIVRHGSHRGSDDENSEEDDDDEEDDEEEEDDSEDGEGMDDFRSGSDRPISRIQVKKASVGRRSEDDLFWSASPQRATSPQRGRLSVDHSYGDTKGTSRSPHSFGNPLDEYAQALRQVCVMEVYS